MAARALHACCALLAVFASPVLAQTAATLNGYRATPLPSDGFVVSGAGVGKHLELSLQLHADYADDPLVYEDIAGASGTERVALVSDQLTLHPTVALGLYDSAVVFVGMPVHAMMKGTALGSEPTSTGFGPGDLALGGRLQFYASEAARVAVQLTVTAPTGEGGEDGRPGVAGDAGTTVEPRIAAELDAGPLEVVLDAGVRLRKDTAFAGARFPDLLTLGAALRLPMLEQRLTAIAELFGEAPLDDVGDRTGSPLQMLLGLKLRPWSNVTLGVSGGAGLLRGYGAPDARVALMFGYVLPLAEEGDDEDEIARARGQEVPQPTAALETPVVNDEFAAGAAPVETIEDRDHDSVADTDDRCPAAPGDPQANGCPELIEYDEEKGAISFLQAVRFASDGTKLRGRSEQSLTEVLALLVAQPQLKVRVEAHLTLGRHGDVVAALRSSAGRAVEVAAFLVERGIAPDRLEAVGCAANRPLVPDVGSQRFKNERVELYVLDPLPATGIRSSLGCIPGEVPGAEPPKALGGEARAVPSKPATPAPAPAPVPAVVPAKPATVTPPAPPVAPAKPAIVPPPAPAVAPAKPALVAPPAASPAPPKPALVAPPVAAAAPAKPVTAAPAPAAAAAPAVAPSAALAATAGGAAVLAALAREPKADADGDGVANGEDACPLAPRSAAGTEPGCPEGHRVDLAGGRIELTRPLRFEEGQSAPSERSAALLDELAATLRANGKMRVLIEVHVAEDASADASMTLTRARAAAVRAALTSRGIPQARMRAYGCGQVRPIAPNNVPWGRKRNERVEVYVLDPAPGSGVHSAEGCAATE